MIGTSSVLPVLNAFTAELFPTELRGDAFAWANNLLGRVGYVLAPLGVGLAADGLGWGPAVAATAAFPLVALGLILRLLPETGGIELEQASALVGPGQVRPGAAEA
jgi:putative MFS transporter